MLYANQTNNGKLFPAVMKAFSDLGVNSENLKIAEEYLNLEQERNNSLLDKIQQQDFSKYANRYTPETSQMDKAVKKEINRQNSDELEERFYLLTYALAGTTCSALGFYIVGDANQKQQLKRVKAFRSVYGEDALAILMAIEFSGRDLMYWRFQENLFSSEYKVEDYLKAIAYTQEDSTKLGFLIAAMNRIPAKTNPLKALLTGKKQEIQQIMKIMDQLIPLRKNFEKYVYLIALALASGYDHKYFELFRQEQKTQLAFAKSVLNSYNPDSLDKIRIFDVLERAETPSAEYIQIIAEARTNEEYLYSCQLKEKDKDAHMKKLAQQFPDEYISSMHEENNVKAAKYMEDILKSVNSSYQGGTTLRDSSRMRIINLLTHKNPEHADIVEKFLTGELSTEELLPILPNLKATLLPFNSSGIYLSAYPMDEFAERCICYRIMKDTEGGMHTLITLPGYDLKTHEKELIHILRKHHVPMTYILNGISSIIENYYSYAEKGVQASITALTEYADELFTMETKPLTADSRIIRIRVLGQANPAKYQEAFFAAADDGSKLVRENAVNYLPVPTNELNQKILGLLQGKKISRREMAVSLLEKNCPECYHSAIQKALETEKNDKLQTRMAALLHQNQPEKAKEITVDRLVETLSKGNRSKKVAWLFDKPFSPVRNLQNEVLEEKYLIALTNCYASMANLSRNEDAEKISSLLNPSDLERFAKEVFSRFIDRGAEAKQKWVIYFSGIHGGFEMVSALQKYIKEWSEHSRGAIASEAVTALALNGSSTALMAVDGMARKFKNRQVRSAANVALSEAAKALNITREELADKIVPDLDFDENLCRIFDYGTRQFRVYLTPALELEIFEGEKKLKNLPKPGKNDDAEKAEQASKAFKEMKKQMKTVVQSQKTRLEYVLLCDRKWTVDSWKELFIRKPVMHCFAIGLIWGAYDEKQQLLQTFRYMEDGTFNTADEEEYTLPENAYIGLIHPVELDEETLSAWREQLSDYEITQPFLQINRPIYRILPEEKGKNALQRYSGTEISNLSLLGKLTKLDWEKGEIMDGGWFYTFTRTDIARQEKDGSQFRKTGYYVELSFSGMHVATGYTDAEEVTIEKVHFWTLDTPKPEENHALALENINPRYFSEIITQLTGIFGGEQTHEE